ELGALGRHGQLRDAPRALHHPIGVEVEQELPRFRLPPGLTIPRDHPFAVRIYGEPRQRSAADLAAQRVEHATDLRNAHAATEKPAHRAQEDEVDEVEAIASAPVTCRADEPGAHALPETRRGN